MPLASLLLLLAASVFAAPAAPVAVSTRAPSLADLVAQVQQSGEGAVITSPLAPQLGIDDPTTTKVLHYPEGSDHLTRSIYVAERQRAFKTGEEPRPGLVIFLTERNVGSVIERRYLRLTEAGKLEQATLVRDKLDADGGLVPGGRTVESISVKKAQDWLDHENDFYFHGKYRKPKEAP